MPMAIEDYALIGDCHTAALIGKNGSIDWLCLPRFDSPSVFGALLGNERHGSWLLAPTDRQATAVRKYRPDTFVLDTRWTTSTGEVQVLEMMPLGDRRADIVRRVRGIRGTVDMQQELRIRFCYATAMPWVQQVDVDGQKAMVATAGPDAVMVRGPRFRPSDHSHAAYFRVSEGETVDTVLTWFPSHRRPPEPLDVDMQLDRTKRWWREWARTCDIPAEYRNEVSRSLLVLRALTHEDTGGIVAAATTSLPEEIGGSRNWDYRYVWLRDAALTLQALMLHGYQREAHSWRNWLLRAIAGDPADIQIMYGIAGERLLIERELDSLPGYLGSAPVRIGNAAFRQYQGDIYGEVMMALHEARELGVVEDQFSWALQRELLRHVEENWERPDNGIWEIRGPERSFTHSKVMLWAALACGIRGVLDHGLKGPVERWIALKEELAAEIEAHAFDKGRNTYTQYYGGTTVDASLLQLAQVGYVAYDDPRMLGTVAALEEDLLRDGLLLRYRTETGVDGLPGNEHPFLACSFWLVEQYARSGRMPEAKALMARLLGMANDVGLLSEEYDVGEGRQIGNTPQAFSHLALVRAADAISGRPNPLDAAGPVD
ncbi:MAG: glycoside hydrolase family 15 protein [Actinomycetota bacterium]|nr:glycoside hydrolase family 15 protein [Actinomycetota bacterium]